MAISICFGLAFATFLVLGVVPCLYLFLSDIGGLAHWLWFGRVKRERDPSPAPADA